MSKFIAHGTTVSIGGTDIGGLTSLSVPDRQKGEAESTDSSSAGDREFLPGLRDGGTVEIEYRKNVEDAGQQALETNYEADDSIEEVVITLPGTAASTSPVTYTFDAFVTNISADLALESDETAMETATLKVTGGVTTDEGT